jgi:hypothetical protein
MRPEVSTLLRARAMRPLRFVVWLLGGWALLALVAIRLVPEHLIGWPVALAIAYMLALVVILHSWLGTVAEIERNAAWQPYRATPWLQSLPVGAAPRLALYPPDARHGDAPVRNVLVLWDPALATIGHGETVEVSGDPGADALVVVRRGAGTFYPVSVKARENNGVNAAAPRLGDGDRIVVPGGRAVLRRTLLRGAFVVAVGLLEAGPGSGRVALAVAVALVPVGALASIPLGYAPGLRGARSCGLSLTSRRLAPGRPTPRLLQARVLLLLALPAVTAVAWLASRRPVDAVGIAALGILGLSAYSAMAENRPNQQRFR